VSALHWIPQNPRSLGRCRFPRGLCLSAVIVVFGLVRLAAQTGFTERVLTEDWKLRPLPAGAVFDPSAAEPANEADWLPVARMPAMVHDVLVQLGRIEPPWMPGRAEACLWVAESDWLYQLDFTAADSGSGAWLVFEAMEGIFDVYLNGRKIASHENAYIPLRVEVSRLLGKSNRLQLHCRSVFRRVNGQSVALTCVDGDENRPVRRPKANYSTYLGPRPYFSRTGVFRAIRLQTTGGSELQEVLAQATLDRDLTEGRVVVQVAGRSAAPSVAVTLRLLGPDGLLVAETETTTVTKDGAFTAQPSLTVVRPELWWPRGYGAQPLYRAEIGLRIEGRLHQRMQRTLGFRRIEMPRLLHFTVNGRPVRLWGGCWVTPRWDSAVWEKARAERLFQLAEHANFNVLRAWGEVEAPPDEFYEMADARGFLVWQDIPDLPLAPDPASLARTRVETEIHVKRLQHHPSILCWCGGNEHAMWAQTEYDMQLQERGPWAGLPAAEVAGDVCRKLDPNRHYQPSSPYYGAEPNDPRQGNTHGYTSMWFVPGYDYLNFASEDTRIAAPVLHSLQRMMRPEDVWPAAYSPGFAPGDLYPFPKTWLAYTTAQSWKKTGPVEQFYDATDAASAVYRLGMAEALYYVDTIERQRRGRPADAADDERRCGGYLVWKFNDSWPQIYAGKVDYFLEPYHAYYALRRAFAPVLLSFEIDSFVRLWAVNDSPAPVSGKVRIRLFNIEQNRYRHEIERELTLAPDRSAVVVRLDEAGIVTFRRDHLLVASWLDAAGRELARSIVLTDLERHVTFPEAKLDVQVREGALAITTDRFARAVTLTGDASGDAFGWFFEDNYFDLLPGETKIVRILGDHRAGRITAQAHYSPYTATVDWRR
jgi:beta-mannosidase